MRASPLERGNRFVRSPDEQPIPGVCDVAFMASEPAPLERMHPVPTLQLVNGACVVAADELDYLLERSEVNVAPAQPLDIARKGRSEVGLEPRHSLGLKGGVKHLASVAVPMPAAGQDRLCVADALETLVVGLRV